MTEPAVESRHCRSEGHSDWGADLSAARDDEGNEAVAGGAGVGTRQFTDSTL